MDRPGRQLADRRVLITGASRGIGRAIARRFAAEGAAVAVGGRDPEAAGAVVEELREHGGTAVAVLGDVAQADDASRVVDEAAGALGGLNLLVNNAGVDCSDWAAVHEWEVAEWDRIIATNLRGPFLVSRAAIPHMLAAGEGSILHISSVCAVTVWAEDCAYGVSKAGLNMLSDHIAVEYGQRGIRSNTLMPGCVRTELRDEVLESMDDGGAFERELLAKHPTGQFGTPEEIAAAALDLCAAEGQFLTGANVAIDGGYSRV